MTRLNVASVVVIVLIVAASGGAVASVTRTFDELSPAAIVIVDRNLDTFKKVRDVAERSGAHCLQMFPPEVIFGRFEGALNPSLLSGLPVTLAFSSGELLGTRLDAGLKKVVGQLFDYREALESALPADLEGGIDDLVLTVPPEVISATTPVGPRRVSALAPVARGIRQNAQFLIGSVLINVIFPESAGGGEDWTDQEIIDAIGALSLGLSQYQQRALWTDLSFLINYRDFVKVPTSYEPIENNMQSDPIWMSEVLNHMGYGGGAYDGAHRLNEAMREEFGTEWVFTAFVADMSNHYNPNPPSPDPGCWGGAGYVAYSYLGGPYLLVPYPACRYGYGLGFGRVFIHEMSHTFWALDEYESAQTLCGAQSGYLAIPTMNTLFKPCIETVPCIMQTSKPPFSEPQPICDYTMGQVGLQDNGNSIPVIYDKLPTVQFLNVLPSTIDTLLPTDTEYQIELIARNDAVRNKNPQMNELERIDVPPSIRRCEVSIQETPFVELASTDGAFDEAEEYVIYIPQLSPGLNQLVFRVRNRVDLTAEILKKVYVFGMRYYFTSSVAYQGYIQLNWVTPREVFGAYFDVLRTDLSAGGSQELIARITEPSEIGPSRRAYGFRDTGVTGGHDYRYRIVAHQDSIRFRGKTYSFDFSSNDIDETAMVALASGLVSPVVPNPMTDIMNFTVDIPKSYRSAGDAPTSVVPRSALAVEVKTPVDVAIYNVLGSRIRTLYSNAIYGGYMPLRWDGTDFHGRRVSPGVYFVYVKAGEKKETRKIVLLR